MKILILLYYFFRSLLLRGPLAHFRLILAELRYDKIYGIQSSGFKTSATKQYYHYQGAPYSVLIPLLKDLFHRYPTHYFMDIGCGKGRVLALAARAGFKALEGIELDGELLQLAENNVKVLKEEQKDLQIMLHKANALEYGYGNKATIYFLFNPFNAEVLGLFIDRVLAQNHQELVFLYMNPVHQVEFAKRKLGPVHRYRTFLYTEALLYRVPARNKN